jgi:hypothetical protein
LVPLQLQGEQNDGRAKALTRLLLPIRYCFNKEQPLTLEAGSCPVPYDCTEWQYETIEPRNIEGIWKRSSYFTVDTSYALFQRARWLGLKRKNNDKTGTHSAQVWTTFSYLAPRASSAESTGRDYCKITVDIAPPAIVLFESGNALLASDREPDADQFFQIGFVYVDCTLKAAQDGSFSGVTLEDLLEFNERARCFWNPWENYKKDYLRVMGNCRHLWANGEVSAELEPFLDSLRKRDELPEPIESGEKEVRREQNKQDNLKCVPFGRMFDLWSAIVSYPVAPNEGEGIRWLNSGKMATNARTWAEHCNVMPEQESLPGTSKSQVSPVPESAMSAESHTGWLATTDYRAFVWTYAYAGRSLADIIDHPADCPEKFGHWVKLLNADNISSYWTKPATVVTSADWTSSFEQDWAKDRTYRRWAHYGTYYGISPHSGAMLTSYDEVSPPYDEHFKTLYFDQVLLLLYLRVMAFQLSVRMARLSAEFADDLAKAAGERGKRRVVEDSRDKFRKVRQMFMSFASLYQFPLLSTQQQGVELYTIYRKFMDIDDLYRDVANEINAWDGAMAQYNQEILAENQDTLSKSVTVITKIGLPIAVVTLLLTGLVYQLELPIGGVALRVKLWKYFQLADSGGHGWPIIIGVLIYLVFGLIVSGLLELLLRRSAIWSRLKKWGKRKQAG